MSSPRDQYLSWGLVDLFSDLLNGRSVDHSWFAGNVVTQRRVGSDDDLLLLAYELVQPITKSLVVLGLEDEGHRRSDSYVQYLKSSGWMRDG